MILPASDSELRPRRSSGVRLAYSDPSGERLRDPSTPQQWSPPSLHTSSSYSDTSNIHRKAYTGARIYGIKQTHTPTHTVDDSYKYHRTRVRSDSYAILNICIAICPRISHTNMCCVAIILYILVYIYNVYIYMYIYIYIYVYIY